MSGERAYVISVSSAYASTIHGVWTQPVAELTADRWNRAFERQGRSLVAVARPLLGKSARDRDEVGAVLAEMAAKSLAAELAHTGCEGCPDCDPDGHLVGSEAGS